MQGEYKMRPYEHTGGLAAAGAGLSFRYKNQPSPVEYNQHTGGLVLGGGGFFIPIRKCSPVSLRFHPTR